MVVTTRRIEELHAEALAAGIDPQPGWGRLEYMDALRAKLGVFDSSMEIDPMKAVDLKKHIDWTKDGAARFEGIGQYLTSAWVAEPKLDGCRMRMFLGLTGNTLNTGRRSVRTYAYTSRTDNFPHLRDAVLPDLAGTVIDGELLAPHGRITTHTGMVTNSLLNASVALCNSGPEGAVSTQQREGWAQLYVFDVLYHNGESVLGQPWFHRRALLEGIVARLAEVCPQVQIVTVMPATAESIDAALRAGLEGVMLKRTDGPYQPGKRSKVWAKVKGFSTADGFIVGYSPGEKGNDGMVGSLNLAVWEAIDANLVAEGALPHGTPTKSIDGQLHYCRPVAQVGNLTEELRREMTDTDGSLKPSWLGRVVEWSAQGLGKNGRARHAHLNRLRPDKVHLECLADQLDVFPAV